MCCPHTTMTKEQEEQFDKLFVKPNIKDLDKLQLLMEIKIFIENYVGTPLNKNNDNFNNN